MANLPTFTPFDAPPEWTAIDFISDLHLWPQTPRTFEAWASYMQGSQADAIFILGDLFDMWVGDDARTQPFEQSAVMVLKASAATRFVAFMGGNRDFLIAGEMLGDSNVFALQDPTLLSAFGKRVLLSHGDELCLSDIEYQRYRTLVRDPDWQRQFLAKPLDERKAFAQRIRDGSEQRRLSSDEPGKWYDLDAPTTLAWMYLASTPDLVHGHTHKPADEELAAGKIRHVLSDWELDVDASTLPRAEVLRLTSTGFERLGLAAATAHAAS